MIKIKRWFCLCLLNSVLVVSTRAQALISGQINIGKRWYELESSPNHTSSIEGELTTFSLFVDPVPFVPVALGVSYSTANLDKAALGNPRIKSAKVSEIGIDGVAWIPFFPLVTPYLGYRYLLSSTLKIGYDLPSLPPTEDDIAGSSIRLGIKYKLVPLVELLLEGSKETQTVETNLGRKNFDSMSALFGIDVGI